MSLLRPATSRRFLLTAVGVATAVCAGTLVAGAAGASPLPATGAAAPALAPPDATPTPSATPTATMSPTATPTATMSPSATPTITTSPPAVPCGVPATVTFDRDTIIATGSAEATVRTTPNSIIDLYAYSQPSRTFRIVRSAEVGNDGTASFRLVPPTNTRVYAEQRGCTTDAAALSRVLNVRTALSLYVTRNGARDYTFTGDSLPARPGGLIISLYRVTPKGQQVLTSQVRAGASDGEWTIHRKFLGNGRFGFVVRTGQDLQNAPGSSNVRPVLIY